MFDLFGRKKKPAPQMDLSAPLSPEADAYLAVASTELNAKHKVLERDWRFGTGKQWAFDQYSGLFKLDFADGAQFNAEGQILGSYFPARNSWEWAWNNPNVEEPMKRDSKLVKELGERLDISYLKVGLVPVPSKEAADYLCSIGVKATDSVGVYQGPAGQLTVMILLKNPRWAKLSA